MTGVFWICSINGAGSLYKIWPGPDNVDDPQFFMHLRPYFPSRFTCGSGAARSWYNSE
jgi:hypothetical protein